MHALRISVALLVVAVGRAASAAETPEEWTKSYSVTGHPEVRVNADDGSVQVITSDAQQVEFRVKTSGSAWGFGFGDKQHIDSKQDGNVVELDVHQGGSYVLGFSNRHIVIEVRMPKSADLKLHTGDGSIDINSVDGDVQATTSDGHVNITQVNGKVEVKSSDGAIVARALKGSVKLSTSDGSIRASELDGGCSASSSDGSVTVEGRFDSLDVRSSDGAVITRVAAGSSMTSGWDVSTSDGAVEVALPQDFKASLDVSTGDGHIVLNLPVQVQGEVSKSHVHGTLNGGGPSFRIHSSDGSVRLSGS